MNLYAYSNSLLRDLFEQFPSLQVFEDAEALVKACSEKPPLYILADGSSIGTAEAEWLSSLAKAVPVVWVSGSVCPDAYPLVSAVGPIAFLAPDGLRSFARDAAADPCAAKARALWLEKLAPLFETSILGNAGEETVSKIMRIASVLSLRSLYVLCICPSGSLSGEHRQAITRLAERDESILFSCPRQEDLLLLCTNPREETCRRLLSDLEQIDPSQEYGIGISRKMSAPFDFHEAWIQAKRATELNFYEPSQLVWYSRQLFTDRHDYKQLVTLEKSLTNAIFSGFTEEELTSIIDSYCSYFEQTRLVPALVCDAVYHYLSSLDRAFKFIDPMCSIDLSFITPEQIASHGTLENLHQMLLQMLLDYLRRGEHYNKSGDRLLEEICAFLDDHLGEDLSLSVVEENFYVNKFVFCRQFKKYTGLTFNEYVRSHRLEKAVELLTKTDERVYEIASQLGFRDESYFSMVFKKEYGVSPSTWRARSSAPQDPSH